MCFRELIVSTSASQQQSIADAKNEQLVAITGNTALCREILDRANELNGQASILSAVKHAYGRGALGIMAATSSLKVKTSCNNTTQRASARSFLRSCITRESRIVTNQLHKCMPNPLSGCSALPPNLINGQISRVGYKTTVSLFTGSRARPVLANRHSCASSSMTSRHASFSKSGAMARAC